VKIMSKGPMTTDNMRDRGSLEEQMGDVDLRGRPQVVERAETVKEREAREATEAADKASERQRQIDAEERDADLAAADAFAQTLGRLIRNCAAQGHSLEEVLTKAAKDQFGIDIRTHLSA
jgi:hypothetical protein